LYHESKGILLAFQGVVKMGQTVINRPKEADNKGRGLSPGRDLSLKTVPRKGEAKMARKKKPRYRVPEKSAWHLYSLQNLNSEKFIKVINKILRREYLVIK
jgi:hypothetical protein